MSTFGSPGSRQIVQKPIPPERGSFPLDHDGECKPLMTRYLACLKAKRGENAAECRALSKAYLGCRMERNLMAPDDYKNLGFAESGLAAVPEISSDPKIGGTETDADITKKKPASNA